MGADDKLYLCISQYDFKVKGMTRFGGGIYLDTDKGNFLLKQRKVSENRVIFEEEIKQLLYNNAFPRTDFCIKNIEDNYVTEGMYGETYTCKHNYYGTMCEMDNPQALLQAVKALACLHNALWGYTPTMTRKSKLKLMADDSLYYAEASELAKEKENNEEADKEDQYFTKADIPYREGLMSELFYKRLSELRRTYKYLGKQKNPLGIETTFISILPEYIKKCNEALAFLDKEADQRLYKEAYQKGNIIHGAFTGHNIIFINDETAVIGFEKARIGACIHDLYMFIKKAGEKNDWNLQLIDNLLKTYNHIRPISSDEFNILMARLKFPEKFWKTINMYFNGKKNWIPGRVEKKLEDVCNMQDKMENTVSQLTL